MNTKNLKRVNLILYLNNIMGGLTKYCAFRYILNILGGISANEMIVKKRCENSLSFINPLFTPVQ